MTLVPGYSGGTATDSHRLPYSPEGNTPSGTQDTRDRNSDTGGVKREVQRIHEEQRRMPLTASGGRQSLQMTDRPAQVSRLVKTTNGSRPAAMCFGCRSTGPLPPSATSGNTHEF